jgi:ankyrin repeat protein
VTTTKRRILVAGLLAAVAVPAFAQFSDSYSFLKAVRDRDGAKVTQIASDPRSTAINARDGGSGEGALHILVRGRDAVWLRYLLAAGARPDLQDNQGDSALIAAARIGWAEGAELLLSRRANVNLANSRGETALIFAVQRRDLPMVRLLMASGADPNRADSVAGYSALDYARRDNRAAAVLRILEQPRREPIQNYGPVR